MAKEGNYIIEPIYQGGYSSLNPDYGGNFTGYRMSAREIGMVTDTRTANILKDLSDNISSGIKVMEISQPDARTFESIPRQHLKEVNQLSKLTGVNVTLHAPIIEPSGIGDKGFGESNRVAAERQMIQAVERAHELSPKGNIPVTFHSSAGLPGEITELGKEIDEIIVINPETGSGNKIPIRKRKYPGEESGIKREVEEANEKSWLSQLRNISYYANWGAKTIQDTGYAAKIDLKENVENLTPEDRRLRSEFKSGSASINNSYGEVRDLFETAYKYGSEEEKHRLNEFAEKIKEKAEKIKQAPDSQTGIIMKKQIIDEGLELFNELRPQVVKPLNEFAKERTAETFANVALHGYKEFKNNAPIISIENPPAGEAFSTGKELKEIVELSREKFIENAKKQGMGESEARNQAEKLIGATLDVGHMNMLRRYGYKNKDLIKEAKEVAPLVKHVHLSDNFGFEHTELPMGMGNVPIKEIMKKLGEEGFEGKKIIEAGDWWQHFSPGAGNKSGSPLKPTLEAFGSPVYAMDMGPYWNQAPGFRQDYSSGIGQIYPQINSETWGTGFSQLPAELGGQRPGAQGSRMSGTPME